MFYETNGVNSDCWQHLSAEIPQNRWFKVEWHFDGNKNFMTLWINGEALYEITVRGKGAGCVSDDLKGRWLFPVFEGVEVGWLDYQAGGGTRDVWIADFVISRKRVIDFAQLWPNGF